jgi:flagellar assembly factor FliW
MEIDTTRFGRITLDEENLIKMPHGMLGFPDIRRFLIIQHRKNSPFLWYQSVDDPALAFVITNPYLFKPDYEIELGDVLEELSWKGDKEALELYVVVNIPQGSPEKMTANLVGPILINSNNSRAVQLVLGNSSYSHQFPLIQEAPLPAASVG